MFAISFCNKTFHSPCALSFVFVCILKYRYELGILVTKFCASRYVCQGERETEFSFDIVTTNALQFGSFGLLSLIILIEFLPRLLFNFFPVLLFILMLALTSVSLLLMMKTKRGYCNRCLNGAGVMERMELCVCCVLLLLRQRKSLI